MDIHSFVLSGQSRAPNHLRISGIDSIPGTDLKLLNFVVEFLAAVVTTNPTGYCYSNYLHCCCWVSRLQVQLFLMMTLEHTRHSTLTLHWIHWKRWEKCWAEKDSMSLARRVLNSRVVERWVLSSCSSGSSLSSSSCPSHLLLRWDTRGCRLPSAQTCFPCLAFPAPSFHVPRELSNRKCRYVSRKSQKAFAKKVPRWISGKFDSLWASCPANETPACTHPHIWLILIYTFPTRDLSSPFCRSWETRVGRSWRGLLSGTRQQFWLISSCDRNLTILSRLWTVFGILSETVPAREKR